MVSNYLYSIFTNMINKDYSYSFSDSPYQMFYVNEAFFLRLKIKIIVVTTFEDIVFKFQIS